MAFIYLILARITTRKWIACGAPSIVFTVFYNTKSVCHLYNQTFITVLPKSPHLAPRCMEAPAPSYPYTGRREAPI